MKIVNETELMANQKASTTITPDVEFEGLETSAGNSVMFSIGYDTVSNTNKFYCTYEVPGDTHGWTRLDIGSVLPAGTVVKSFDVGQDLAAGTIDLALVVTVGTQDQLYIAYNVADSNLAGIPAAWQQFAFDDQNNMQYAGKPINDVFVTRANNQMFVFADINTQDATNTLTRYAVDQSNSIMLNILGFQQAWIPHGMAMDAQAGAITNAIGCGPDDAASGGIYTLCNIANIPQLQYTGLFNSNDPGGPAFPVNFQLPSGTDATYRAMAVSASAQTPYTDLFFATNTTVNGNPTGALYFIPYASQTGAPPLAQVYTHDLLYNIESLHVNNWNDNIVLWGQSQYTDPVTNAVSSQLFVMECVRGNETNADAWSNPIPLLIGVENSATYINNTYSSHSSIDPVNGNAYGSCSVIFAHQADGSLVKLFQDPVTTAWQERFLLTEPLDATTVLYETTSYTSHVKITDDNNMVQPFIPVSIWASSPCSVYVNEVYSNLAFTAPLQTTADESGVVNIMQPVDTIGGISYYVAVQDPNTQQWYTQVINPFTATTANIKSQVPDGTNNHLSGSVTDEMGASTPLAPNASADEQLATSKNIYSFYTNADQANLNADGLTTDQESAGGWPNPGVSAMQAIKPLTPVQRPRAKPDRLAKHLRFNPEKDKIWGCTFGKNAKHFEGIEEMKAMGLVVHADGSMSLTMANGELGSFLGAIESKAGHLFKWMKSEAEKLEQAVIKLGEDGLDCLLTIAGDIYHFVVKCVNDVVNAIHTVLNAIKTAFEDLIKWIGSIFAWSDFIATHSVIKNLFMVYGNYCIDSIDTTIANFDGMVDNIMGAINAWADIPDDSAQSQSASNNQDSGQHKPQSNWGHHHMKNNAANSICNLAPSDATDMIAALVTAVTNEGEILANTLQQLEDIDLTTISMADLVKRLVGIAADTVLQSMQDIVTAFLQVIGDLVQGMMDTMSKEQLTIPVLSQLYEHYVGSPLTILDLICLICSIPVTVMYKLLNKGVAPFPAGDPDTIALAGAADYASLALLCGEPSDTQTSAQGLLGDATWNPPKLYNRWYRLFFAGNVMALFGGLGIAAFGYAKTKDETNKNLALGYTISYFPYIGPDIVGNIPAMIVKDSRWYSVLNGALAVAGVLKAIVDTAIVFNPAEVNPAAPPSWLKQKTGKGGYDFASPILDAVLNGFWEWPVVEAFTHSNKIANDIVDLVANTAFNASGVVAPFITFEVPPGQPFWLVGQTALNVVYGLGSIAESVDGQPIDPIIT